MTAPSDWDRFNLRNYVINHFHIYSKSRFCEKSQTLPSSKSAYLYMQLPPKFCGCSTKCLKRSHASETNSFQNRVLQPSVGGGGGGFENYCAANSCTHVKLDWDLWSPFQSKPGHKNFQTCCRFIASQILGLLSLNSYHLLDWFCMHCERPQNTASIDHTGAIHIHT